MRHIVLPAFLAFVVSTSVLLAQAPNAAATPNAAANGPVQDTANLQLANVKWAGPPVSLDNLRGKSVAVMVYATWCPKCNAWSGEMFSQLKTAIKDKPVVLLSINVDEDPSEVQNYIKERDFFAPNILHGYDPKMVQRLGLDSDLFKFVMLGPSGEVTKRGEAGSYFNMPNGKEYVLARELTGATGEFKILTAGLSPNVQSALWPLELGLANDVAYTKIRTAMSPEEQEEADGVVGKVLDAKLEDVKKGYKAEDLMERFSAYDKAQEVAGMFKTLPQNKTARDVINFMEHDEQFKKELTARKGYQNSMTKPPAARKSLLKSLATRYPGTHYGELAKTAE